MHIASIKALSVDKGGDKCFHSALDYKVLNHEQQQHGLDHLSRTSCRRISNTVCRVRLLQSCQVILDISGSHIAFNEATGNVQGKLY